MAQQECNDILESDRYKKLITTPEMASDDRECICEARAQWSSRADLDDGYSLLAKSGMLDVRLCMDRHYP